LFGVVIPSFEEGAPRLGDLIIQNHIEEQDQQT